MRAIPDSGASAAQATIALLRSAGAAELNHAGERTLLDHLMATQAILARWEQPVWLQQAGLLHSVYGTDTYRPQLLNAGLRAEVAAVAGERAERIAYLFSVTPRAPLLAGTHLWAREMPTRSIEGAPDDAGPPPTRQELDALVLLHMANMAEQTRATDGSPGLWLARLGELAGLLGDGSEITPPAFIARLSEFSGEDESQARRAYRDAWGHDVAADAQRDRLALAAALCPVAAEPCVWLAHLARSRDDRAAAESWAEVARQRLLELGTPWDKRLSFEDWLALVERVPESDATPDAVHGGHPRDLLRAYAPATCANGVANRARNRISPPDDQTGRRRFFRYVENLGDGDAPASGALYPDLPSLPWHDPAQFPLVEYLEANFPAIREEILSLGTDSFHRESERIRRSGDWDVAFLYERGRRHDDVCEACPVTARGIEIYPTIRSLAGLIYISRMRPGTHIAPHRGPTNLRLRCHLGVTVPAGDCALRVGDETRCWEAGQCLVFDDRFDHEAWNRTDEERLVLIVDLWHPGLSATEVGLLEGLHRYADLHARKLSRYWSANAAAARANPRPG